MADAGSVIEIVRATARISLVLFCVAFAAELRFRDETLKRLGFVVFYVAQASHLAFVALYYNGLGEWPAIEPSTILLFLGVLAFVWIGVALLSSYEMSDRRTFAPPFMLWYLWFLFGATHISRLLDPERAGPINWILLAVVLVAGILRRRAVTRP